MKKFVSMALVLTLMLTLLAGCGGKTEETQAPETTLPVVETTEPVIEETENTKWKHPRPRLLPKAKWLL